MSVAVKSIIDIDVNDEAFQRFQALFAEYEEKVKELPGDWKKVDDAMGGAAKRFAAASGQTDAILAGIAASAGVIAESIHKASKAQHQFEGATRRSHGAMNALGSAALKVSHTIFGMGKWMLKMGAIGGSLASLGGAIGLDDLAGSALNRQKSARGVGMTPGQKSAFSTYYNQFGNADAVASNVASARNDISKRWAFTGIGVSQSALQNDNNFQLSMDVVSKIQHALKKMPRADWQNIAQARGFNMFMSMDEMRVLRHTSNARVDAAWRGAEKNVSTLGFSNGVAREWATLSIQMHKAGVEIESSLIVGLHKLAPVITKALTDISNWVSAFARGPEMGKIIGEVSTDLQKFVSFVGSSKFQTDVAQFTTAIAQLARETVNALRYFHLIPSASISDSQRLKQAVAIPKTAPHAGRVAHFAAYVDKHLDMRPSKQSIYEAAVAAHKKYPDVPVRELMKLASIESSTGKNMLGPKTAYGRPEGPWQMMPGTAKAMGAHDIMGSVHNAAMGAARYLHLLGKQFGSQKVALAAYEAGPGTVAAQMKAHPHTWLASAGPAERKETTAAAHAHLPAKVDRLIDTLRRQRPMRPQQVTIRNQTSARVALQANAAAF